MLEYRVRTPGGQLLDSHRTEHEIEPPDDAGDTFEITFEVGIRGQPKRQGRAAIPTAVEPGKVVIVRQDLHLSGTHVEETRRSTVPATVKWGDS